MWTTSKVDNFEKKKRIKIWQCDKHLNLTLWQTFKFDKCDKRYNLTNKTNFHIWQTWQTFIFGKYESMYNFDKCDKLSELIFLQNFQIPFDEGVKIEFWQGDTFKFGNWILKKKQIGKPTLVRIVYPGVIMEFPMIKEINWLKIHFRFILDSFQGTVYTWLSGLKCVLIIVINPLFMWFWIKYSVIVGSFFSEHAINNQYDN